MDEEAITPCPYIVSWSENDNSDHGIAGIFTEGQAEAYVAHMKYIGCYKNI